MGGIAGEFLGDVACCCDGSGTKGEVEPLLSCLERLNGCDKTEEAEKVEEPRRDEWLSDSAVGSELDEMEEVWRGWLNDCGLEGRRDEGEYEACDREERDEGEGGGCAERRRSRDTDEKSCSLNFFF